MARTNHNGKCGRCADLLADSRGGSFILHRVLFGPSKTTHRWLFEWSAQQCKRRPRVRISSLPAISKRMPWCICSKTTARCSALASLKRHIMAVHATPLASFINAVNPQLIVQSTGPRRLQKDLFASHIGSRQRLATNAAGAISVTWSEAGQLEWSSHLVPTSHDIKRPASLEAGR